MLSTIYYLPIRKANVMTFFEIPHVLKRETLCLGDVVSTIAYLLDGGSYPREERAF